MLPRKVRALRGRVSQLFGGKAARRHAAVGPAHQWKMKRRFQIEFLTQQGLEPHHRLIDVGCGTLRGGIPLIEFLDPGHYTGIEVREEVLQLGREELREAALEHKGPTLIHSTDLSTLELENRADFIWAFSVMIHMSDDALDGCLAFVSKHLAPNGVFFGNVNIGESKEGSWQGFPVVHRPRSWYEQMVRRHGLELRDVGALVEVGHADSRPNPESRRVLEIRLRRTNPVL